jgi:hypothetical protein
LRAARNDNLAKTTVARAGKRYLAPRNHISRRESISSAEIW